MTDWADEKAIDFFDRLTGGLWPLTAMRERELARVLREARIKGIEEAIEAVADAGGDNCDYHIEAIRKLKEQP